MKRWNWRSYAAGIVTATMIFGITGGALAASSGNISFNTVNISANGVSIARQGSGYAVQNGAYVPYSITYTDAFGGGTTYVPISKLSEFTGTGVTWEAATNTVLINADTTAAYDRLTGKSTSYDSGYDVGYQAGLSARSSSGRYDDGYDDGYADAKKKYSGSGSSYSDGYDNGYDDGYDDGRGTATSSSSYNDGYDDGYDKGYDDGVEDGKDETTGDRYQEGYNAGFTAGKAEGKQEGYQEGYEDGYADGEADEVEDPNKPSEPGGSDIEFDRNSVSEEDMQNYLDRHVPSTVETPLGVYEFTFDVSKNNVYVTAYDFRIETDWSSNLSWVDFEYSMDIDRGDLEETLSILRNYQKEVYSIAWECAPGAKLEGAFYSSYYKYPNIHEGYTSTSVFSWKNYGPDIAMTYYDSYVTDFQWTPVFDDYEF